MIYINKKQLTVILSRTMHTQRRNRLRNKKSNPEYAVIYSGAEYAAIVRLRGIQR